MANFKALIEETVALNKRPAVLVCHSMGCLFSYRFLADQSDQWKKEYVKGWVVVGAPFGGNFKYMYSFIGDDDWPATISKKIRIPERTFSSTTFLMPAGRAFGGDVLVRTPRKNYTVDDYAEFFAALDYPDAYEQYLDTRNILGDPLVSPGRMPVYCIGGVGIRSIESVVYDQELSRSASYQTIYGDGDGILNAKGMRQCQRFSVGSSKFVYQEFNLGKFLRPD